MKRRLAATVLALGVMFGAYGKSFSLDLRSPRPDGARAKLLAATPAPDEGTLRSFDLDAGVADVGAVALGDELTFALFDDVTLKLVLKEKVPTPLGGEAFLAEAAGYEGVKTAVVLRTADGLTIDVQDFRNRKCYKVLSTPDGVKVQEMEAKGGACGCDARAPGIASARRSTRKTSANVSSASAGKALLGAPDGGTEETFVDILVAFDGNALSWARKNGGGVTNFAQTAVQKMNMALANTGLDASFRFRLVGVVGVAASSADLEYALEAAYDGWSGWDAIGEKREKVGADIVTVLVDTGSAYGTVGLGFSLYDTDFDGFSESAYNACAIRSVAQSHTMTHEVGHNMGCGHSDRQTSDPGPQLYDYSAGYYFSAGGEGFHTIMAYGGEGPWGDEVEVPYFSSPKHTYRGVTVGDQTHDNTRTLANTFAAAAKWRAATGADIDGDGMDVPIEWVTSRSTALARARAEGKNIFLISGRDTCPNTMGTRNNSCEVPDVKRHLIKNYVCWYNVIDRQASESQKYFSGFSIGDTLPFIAVIDAEKDATLAAEGGYHEAADILLLLGRAAQEIAFTPDGGPFADPLSVTMTAKSGGEIYYTLDGTLPDETSLRYEGPIVLDASATICAREFADGEFGLPARVRFVRLLTERHDGYEWTVEVVDDGCVVTSIQPAPAGNVLIPANVMGFDVVGFDETLFQDNLNITSISIPATVRHFDGWSFYGSRNLVAINVNAANENLLSENGVVYDKLRTTLICCPPGVKYLEIPGDISEIGDDACVGLWHVKEVYIPANVTSIGFEAFADCKALTTVVISEEVMELGYDAFSYCPKLANAWLPACLEYGYMEYDSFYRQSGRVSLHYYSGGLDMFMVCFDPCDSELEEVFRSIPSIDGKALMTIGTLPVPMRPMDTFIGWFTEPDGGTKVTATTKVTEDVTYYAHWLAFAVNGETWASAETSMETNILCGVALRWPVAASAFSDVKVKVAGLPAGLKFTDKDIYKKGSKTEVEIPANTIYGAPAAASKAGKSAGAGRQPYQVKITVTTGGKSSTSTTYLLKLTVDPLPAWAVGSFEGFVRQFVSDSGVATMSVTAAGKISGKIASCGTNWTFKADSFAAGSVATNFAVDAVATAGKDSRDIQLNVASFPTEYIPDSATARAEGCFGDLSATLFRLPWADKGDVDVKSYLSAHAGTYTCKVPYGENDEGEAKFTFDEKGVAKGTVVLPDGTKTRKAAFSASALTYAESIYIAIYAATDAKKGYPAVFDLRQLCEWSGPDDAAIAYRDPGVHVTTEERNKGSGASGTVTVNPKYGQAAAGKDVTLTAKPTDKNSVFSCWVVDGADTAGLDLTSPSIKLKANGTDDIHVTAQFITAAEDAAHVSLAVDGVEMAAAVAGQPPYQVNAMCGVYLEWPVAVDAWSLATVKVAGLPSGLKFTDKGVLKKGSKTEYDVPPFTIYGAPTAASKKDKDGNVVPSQVKVTVTTAGKTKIDYTIALTVDPIAPAAVGTYNGLVGRYRDGAYGETFCAVGMVTLTAGANGKVTAKATLPSGAVSFSAPRWDSFEDDVYAVEMSAKSGEVLAVALDSARDWWVARVDEPSALTIPGKEPYRVVAWRNEHGGGGQIVADKNARDLIAKLPLSPKYKMYYALDGGGDAGYNVAGYGDHKPSSAKNPLELLAGANGTIKYAGKLEGKSFSGSAVLNIIDEGYRHWEWESVNECVMGDFVVFPSRTEAVHFVIRFGPHTDRISPSVNYTAE